MRHRFPAGIVVGLLCLGTAAVVQGAGATPASAIPGLVRVEQESTTGDVSTKTAFAICPSGTVVIGGGGRVNDFGAGKVMLTTMRPARTDFAASAGAPPGFTDFWTLTAYAICARAPFGLEVVHTRGASSTSTFKQTIASCPSGKRVISSGASVGGGRDDVFSPQRVGLVLARPDGALTFGRAVAREIGAGYSGSWSVDSYVVCVSPPISGHQNVAQVVGGSTAAVGCPSGTQVHGVGGGGSIFDVGPFFLQSAYPLSELTAVLATMTSAPSNGMVAQATCAR